MRLAVFNFEIWPAHRIIIRTTAQNFVFFDLSTIKSFPIIVVSTSLGLVNFIRPEIPL